MIYNGNGQPFMDVVIRFFQEDHWNYQKNTHNATVRAGYRGEHGTWICNAKLCVESQPGVESQRFVFYSHMGMNIPPLYRPAVNEYLMRVNYTLTLGNFEMDMDTGDVRFRTSIEILDRELTVDMMRSLAYANVNTIDRYFPGLLSVVHGGLSPEAALARVETQVMEI